MARNHGRDTTSRARKRTSSTAFIDLCPCPECGMSNPVLVESERPTECQWCGTSLESGITAKPRDFEVKKAQYDEDAKVGTKTARKLAGRMRGRPETKAQGGTRDDSANKSVVKHK